MAARPGALFLPARNNRFCKCFLFSISFAKISWNRKSISHIRAGERPGRNLEAREKILPRQLLLMLMVGLLGLVLAACSRPAPEGKTPPPPANPGKKELLLGGPCSYRDYPGRATVRSVSPAPRQDQKGLFEVRFTFQPRRPLEKKWGHLRGREFLMTLKGGHLPDREFLQKHGIAPGKEIECTLSVITKGTCTPWIFQWPFEQK